MASRMTNRLLQNFVDGAWQPALSGRTSEREDPADPGRVVAVQPASDERDVSDAVDSARRALATWSARSAPERAAILATALDLIAGRADEVALAVTFENGKVLAESKAEVARSIAAARYQLSLAYRLGSDHFESERTSVIAWTHRVPLGVVALITPWNFPVSTALRKLIPALIAGNTVVLKPSVLTSISSTILLNALFDAGVPAGVVNLVIGSGAEAGTALVANPGIDGISFTGSTDIGRGIARVIGDRDVKVQLEMGGKNALVVAADADLARAVDGALIAGYTCAGQWCGSTSRVYVVKSFLDQFAEQLAARADALEVGPGTAPSSQMGPLVSAHQAARVQEFIAGRSERTTIVTRRATIDRKGSFVAPTVVTTIDPTERLLSEEIFGPLVAVVGVDDLDEAIGHTNVSPYGLNASLYTGSLTVVRRFLREVRVGRIGVNLHTAYGEPQLAGGGIKESGRGGPEGGDAGVLFFSHHQSVYIDMDA